MNITRLHHRCATTDNSGPLSLRVAGGLIFIARGARKRFGWFGGHGQQGTGRWMESIGIAARVLMAALAGAASVDRALTTSARLGGVSAKPATASR